MTFVMFARSIVVIEYVLSLTSADCYHCIVAPLECRTFYKLRYISYTCTPSVEGDFAGVQV